MTETEFLALVDQVLDSIESQADDWAAGLDVDIEATRSGNVLTLVFEDGTQVVVNAQAAMQELWVAARSGGFHYRYDGQHWNDTRGVRACPMPCRRSVPRPPACRFRCASDCISVKPGRDACVPARLPTGQNGMFWLQGCDPCVPTPGATRIELSLPPVSPFRKSPSASPAWASPGAPPPGRAGTR